MLTKLISIANQSMYTYLYLTLHIDLTVGVER